MLQRVMKMLEGVMQRTQVGRLMWQRRASPTAAAAERVQVSAWQCLAMVLLRAAEGCMPL